MSRLFRQDRLIAWNTTRGTFPTWHDRAIAALLLLPALAAAHGWIVASPWRTAAWIAAAVSTVIGIGVGHLVAKRLAFHAFDGLLAADALLSGTRRRYKAVLYGVGLALPSAGVLMGRPSLLIISVPAYLIGVLAAALGGNFMATKRLTGTPHAMWTFRAWSRRRVAALSAAATLLLSLFLASSTGPQSQVAVAGFGTFLLTMVLTSVDDAVVRFMTLAGHGSWRVVAYHGRGAASFLAIAVPGCWALAGMIAAAVVVSTASAMLLLLTLRIFTYQLHTRRFADTLVSILAGTLVLVAYSMPLALPILAAAILWQLRRRVQAKTWLLA